MAKRRAQHPPNHIRMHRHQSGLTQRELGQVLGDVGKGSVARYERLRDLPPLATAIRFEIIFRVPISELFWGLRDALEKDIEAHLALLERNLGERNARDRDANATAKKLMWLAQRKSPLTSA